MMLHGRFFRRLRAALPLLALGLLAAAGLPARGEPNAAANNDFRVRSAVYVDGSREPVSQSDTFFNGPLVFDFSSSNGVEETVMFNTLEKEFILLDHRRRVRSKISRDDLLLLVTEVTVRAGQTSDSHKPLPKFMARPAFQTSFDPGGERLTLQSPLLTFRVDTVSPPDADVAMRYREFADWFGRLAVTHSGSLPPAPRIEVNRQLSERQLLPARVEREYSSAPANAPGRVARSEHSYQYRYQLTPADEARIKQTHLQAQEYHPVPISEYRDWK